MSSTGVAAGGAVVNRGTVVRIRLRVPGDGDSLPVASRPVVIGSGFAEHTDPAALVVGPTGLTLGRLENTLYVAGTASNRISAIPDASTRTRTAFTGVDLTSGGHLNSPLGLALAPNGDVLSVNAADGLILETTPAGDQVATMTLDATGTPPGSGTLFGLAVTPDGTGVYFVDDGTNTLNILHGTRRLVHRFIAGGSRGRGPVEPGRSRARAHLYAEGSVFMFPHRACIDL
jgi:DNA-binding beta-propeller fold protein YncE